MKTTVEITDDLFKAAKALAIERRTTLRAIIEEGLRAVIGDTSRRDRFELKDGSVEGYGTRPGVEEGDWESVGDTIYRGRGS
jgi:hypothetical protein